MGGRCCTLKNGPCQSVYLFFFSFFCFFVFWFFFYRFFTVFSVYLFFLFVYLFFLFTVFFLITVFLLFSVYSFLFFQFTIFLICLPFFYVTGVKEPLSGPTFTDLYFQACHHVRRSELGPQVASRQGQRKVGDILHTSSCCVVESILKSSLHMRQCFINYYYEKKIISHYYYYYYLVVLFLPS